MNLLPAMSAVLKSLPDSVRVNMLAKAPEITKDCGYLSNKIEVHTGVYVLPYSQNMARGETKTKQGACHSKKKEKDGKKEGKGREKEGKTKGKRREKEGKKKGKRRERKGKRRGKEEKRFSSKPIRSASNNLIKVQRHRTHFSLNFKDSV